MKVFVSFRDRQAAGRDLDPGVPYESSPELRPPYVLLRSPLLGAPERGPFGFDFLPDPRPLGNRFPPAPGARRGRPCFPPFIGTSPAGYSQSRKKALAKKAW
jgi:hypothetical protein